jgi:hypothetical protein
MYYESGTHKVDTTIATVTVESIPIATMKPSFVESIPIFVP